jgi:hypothetical protein
MALSSTVFRLYRRHKQKNLWWDDYSVFVALVLDLVYCSTIALVQGESHRVLLNTAPDGVFEEIPSNMLPPPAVRSRKIVAFWITGSLPTVIIW